jgi:hypothetical protein
MNKRYVYLRPLANGLSFPTGIIDTKTKETLHLENDIVKVMEWLDRIEMKKSIGE